MLLPELNGNSGSSRPALPFAWGRGAFAGHGHCPWAPVLVTGALWGAHKTAGPQVGSGHFQSRLSSTMKINVAVPPSGPPDYFSNSHRSRQRTPNYVFFPFAHQSLKASSYKRVIRATSCPTSRPWGFLEAGREKRTLPEVPSIYIYTGRARCRPLARVPHRISEQLWELGSFSPH